MQKCIKLIYLYSNVYIKTKIDRKRRCVNVKGDAINLTHSNR